MWTAAGCPGRRGGVLSGGRLAVQALPAPNRGRLPRLAGPYEVPRPVVYVDLKLMPPCEHDRTALLAASSRKTAGWTSTNPLTPTSSGLSVGAWLS